MLEKLFNATIIHMYLQVRSNNSLIVDMNLKKNDPSV